MNAEMASEHIQSFQVGPSKENSFLPENAATARSPENALDLPPIPSAPDFIQRLFGSAMVLIENEEFSPAASLLRNILMRDPENVLSMLWLGRVSQSLGKLDDAVKCYKALVSREPSDVAWSHLGEVYYLLGKDEEALEAYQESLLHFRDEGPLLFEVYKNLGNIHARAADFEAAEENYHKAFTLNPNSDALMVNYGTLEVQRDHVEAALQRFRQAVDMNASNDKGWVGLALMHRHMGDLELSWANLQRALDINGKNATAIRLAVEWGVFDGKLEVAISCLKDYLGHVGDDAEMSFQLAKIFVHLNRLAEAETELERTLALSPELEGAAQVMELVRAAKRTLPFGQSSKLVSSCKNN